MTLVRTSDPTEVWLIDRGLPQMLPRRVRARGLVARVAPMATLLILLEVSALGALTLAGGPEAEASELTLMIAALILVAVGPVAAMVLTWALERLLRRLPDRCSTAIGYAIAVIWLVALPSVSAPWLRGSGWNWQAIWSTIGFRVVIYLLFLALTYQGAGVILRWSLRRSAQEIWALGPMVIRVLPVLFLAVLFLFFNAEIWQIATALSLPRTFAVASVLFTLTVLVVVVTAQDELRPLLTRSAATDLRPDPDEFAALIADTPVEGANPPDRHPPLGAGERFNLLLIQVAAQLAQVALFTLLMLTFFILFGQLSIQEPTIKSWIGRPSEILAIAGLRTAISVELFKVSIVLASFCGLSFAASSGADTTYRTAFLDPILSETRTDLAVRDVYRARNRRPEVEGS